MDTSFPSIIASDIIAIGTHRRALFILQIHSALIPERRMNDYTCTIVPFRMDFLKVTRMIIRLEWGSVQMKLASTISSYGNFRT